MPSRPAELSRQTQVRPPQPPPSRAPELPPAVFEGPTFSQDSRPPAPHGPIRMESSLPPEPKVANLPPVTLQLLKQSIMFDNDVPRDVLISLVIQDNPRTWVQLAAYTGAYLLLDDKVAGPGLKIRLTVSQYAGSFSYLVVGQAQ